jgi:hypothetical protein
MRKEAEVMSSRYATRQEVLDSLISSRAASSGRSLPRKRRSPQAPNIHQRADSASSPAPPALLIG